MLKQINCKYCKQPFMADHSEGKGKPKPKIVFCSQGCCDNYNKYAKLDRAFSSLFILFFLFYQ